MEVISIVHPLQMNMLPVEIAKALYLKTAFLVARLDSNLSILILGGRVQQQMHMYMRMHS
jgi:hypothetical protein